MYPIQLSFSQIYKNFRDIVVYPGIDKMRTTTDNRTTCGQLKMLSAFHQKKMRTTFIFQILMRITFWKCGQPKIVCISSKKISEYDTDNMKMLPAFEKKKMCTTLLAKDDTDNMKMLSAFHKKKMPTTFLFEKWWCRQVLTLIHLYFKRWYKLFTY